VLAGEAAPEITERGRRAELPLPDLLHLWVDLIMDERAVENTGVLLHRVMPSHPELVDNVIALAFHRV
jgi:hypothetical protein